MTSARHITDLDDFVHQLSTTRVYDVVLHLADMQNETMDTADVSFTSFQAAEFGPAGEVCTRWHLEYSMRIDSGYWQIDGAKNLGGSPAPCRSPGE